MRKLSEYSEKDVAQIFKVSERTVRRWVESNELKSRRAGKYTFINYFDIHKFVESISSTTRRLKYNEMLKEYSTMRLGFKLK